MELARCNQRGGRMLSVFDLLAAETLDLDLAAYFLAHISRGASFMIGARPGGAGKTTVMCALLNFVPADTILTAAADGTLRGYLRSQGGERTCLICHEIGSGPYFAYLWDEPLRRFCAMSDNGCMLAANLHADDIDEARIQVCEENGVPHKHFTAFQLLAFLRVEGSWHAPRRRVERVYASDGTSPHQLVFEHGRGLFSRDAAPDNAWFCECRDFLARNAGETAMTIEKARGLVLDFLAS